ncbi:receptor-like cytosolic serine/threonine-protein kinase RBK1 [Andrographis paniculata]|uniref:receptor-like cytosolic serine/threonine-protein kinase RBK1 n=1 Tax=Andrographis paniculata TaxID=175694 RepID=UPI0021E7F2FA|nr:receptor-like cytosolic serine/threonine-protein kinase RBK1 [Andrographis paniculata]
MEGAFEHEERDYVRKEKEEEEEDRGAGEMEEQSSPRGILEVHVSGSDSDNSGSLMDSRSSSFGGEKSPETAEKAAAATAEADWSYGNLNWKKLLGQVKKSSPTWRFSNIPVLAGYNLSKKSGKKSRSRVSVDALDCGDFVMPKPSWRNFTYDELKQATDDFSPDKLLGKGGHAEVYKGSLSDGQVVAVKKIIKEQKNNEDKIRDFLTELGILAHIDHPNAAKLIGFGCDRGLFLVLQFSPHGSLGTALHGSDEDSMDWQIRYKVAVGIAEGLEYLHCGCQRRIIHRDITASNILLSEDYQAEISDFGLAKWLPENWANIVVSPIEGTFGYMAPEYFMHGIVHEKSDVFAFGVLLLELITGRRAVDSSRQSLAIWAKPHLDQNNVKEIADPRLGDSYDVVEMKRAMYTASVCINHLPNMRPNMTGVVQLLKGTHEGIEMNQRSATERTMLFDTCDVEGYTSSTYLKDLNRHMELVME